MRHTGVKAKTCNFCNGKYRVAVEDEGEGVLLVISGLTTLSNGDVILGQLAARELAEHLLDLTKAYR